jgi:transposase-like protein
MRYSEEIKRAMTERMVGPSGETAARLAKETGISESVLYKWQKKAKEQGIVFGTEARKGEKWNTREKFAVVLEISSLNEAEVSEYCRKQGLYVEQVEAWRDACMQANGGIAYEASQLKKELQTKERELKKTQQELKRKEAALAETAALLVLKKKAQAIWGDQEDE